MKERFSVFKSFLPAILTIALFYILLETIGITCPIKFITGISCGGCGMSRAWLSVLRGDLHSAFYFHPLFFTVPFMMLTLFFYSKIPKKSRRIIICVFIFLFLSVYIIRLVDPRNDIVVFRPSESIFSKVFFYLKDFYV